MNGYICIYMYLQFYNHLLVSEAKTTVSSIFISRFGEILYALKSIEINSKVNNVKVYYLYKTSIHVVLK